MMKTGQITKKDVTILYVEDEDFIRKEIASILQIITDNVIVAQDGQKGLDAFRQNNIDLVVTDINMPLINGFEMLKQIRTTHPEVPAIILSAYSQSEFIKQASEIDNINEYLLKPVDISLLLEKINLSIEKIQEKKNHKNIIKLFEQYKIAVDNSAIVSKTNPKGVITYVNDIFCEISEYSKEELLGKNHNILRHPDMPADAFKDLWHTIKEKKEIWKGKIKNQTKSGGYYIVDATVVPIINNDGLIEEFIALRHDITEVEAYKEILKNQLSSSEDTLQEKVHLLGEYENTIDLSAVLIRMNTDKKISFANERFEDVTQYTHDELIFQDFTKIIHPDSQNIWTEIQKSIAQDHSYKGTIKGLNKHNTVFYLDITFRAIFNTRQEIIEYMGIGKDITETIQLYKEIEDTQKDVIFSLGTIGEARSKETGNHVKRVAEYSYLMAKKLGLNDHECEIIKLASPMHDIGKIGIPDKILNKPARFTKEEFEVMKEHATIGYNMLKNSSREILKASAIIAHEHHEKWDGNGYPRNIQGEQIHIYGRITAIADVFDALGSDRCYKKAWPLEKILNLLENERGKHFDPTLVDIFLHNLDDFLAIRDRYSDMYEDTDSLENLR